MTGDVVTWVWDVLRLTEQPSVASGTLAGEAMWVVIGDTASPVLARDIITGENETEKSFCVFTTVCVCVCVRVCLSYLNYYAPPTCNPRHSNQVDICSDLYHRSLDQSTSQDSHSSEGESEGEREGGREGCKELSSHNSHFTHSTQFLIFWAHYMSTVSGIVVRILD